SRTSWFPRAKATVIYNGIDLDDYDRLGERKPEIRQWFRRSLGLERDACLITLIGELNERKGHRFVIGAAREIIDEHPHARFLFVGDGDARVHIERLLDEGGLRDRCLMLGFRSDVPDILTASDILVLPSRVEGFGYVLVEAMAARLPVVASNTSSIPEIVTHGETGYLHDMGDQQAIAVCLKRLLVDPGLRQSMGEAGYQVVKRKFSYAVMIDQLEQLFFEQRPHEKAGGG
ncbi:MAG: glycosyltransferase, partial [Candidatus Krumholzibacteria bacterium]|nr:glycosyltransferase [Candidatus Krumholzibacteria bacterium]